MTHPTTLPIDSVIPAEDNLRHNATADKEMIASVKALGILEPLLVTPRPVDDDGFQYLLVAGHRRLDAARKAGLEEVPVHVRELSEDERVMAMLVENLKREDLDPVEEADGYFRLIEAGMKKKDLAAAVGRSQKLIGERMKLLVLPAKAKAAVSAGKLKVSDAVELAEQVNAAPEVAELLEGVKDYDGDIAYRLKEEAEQRALDAAVAALRQELVDQGVTVVDKEQVTSSWGGHEWKLPKGCKAIGGYGGVDLDAKKHKSEPCAAVTIELPHRYGMGAKIPKAVDVCTAVSRHNERGDSKLKKRSGVGSPSENDKRSKAKADKDRNLELRAQRNKELHDAIKAAKKPELVDYLVELAVAITQNWPHDESDELTCSLLGVQAAVVDNGVGLSRPRTAEAIAAVAERDPLRVAVAALMARMERRILQEHYYSREAEIAAHLAWTNGRVEALDDPTAKAYKAKRLRDEGATSWSEAALDRVDDDDEVEPTDEELAALEAADNVVDVVGEDFETPEEEVPVGSLEDLAELVDE